MKYYLEDVKKVYEAGLPTLVYYAQEIHQRMQVVDSAMINQAQANKTESAPLMGNTPEQRLAALVELANMETQPDVLPLDVLAPQADAFEVVRLVAVARIMMPKTVIQIRGGDGGMTAEAQALCLCAGANSLTARGDDGKAFLDSLKMHVLDPEEHRRKMHGCKGDGSCGREGCKGDGSCGRHDHSH